MSFRVEKSVRLLGAATLLSVMWVAPAAAQTTVVLDNPSGEVADAFIRAGSYANTVFNNGELVTKANSQADYVRRALVKFDTENFVPANTTIRSATLTLTLKNSESSTRIISAYRVANSFDETAATWHRRKTDGRRWGTSGGDLGALYATATVGTTAGTRVSFNVTALVQKAVNGNFGSRYTRIALIDAGSTSSTSLKEFYSSEASDPTVRPKLTIVYGGSSSTPAPAPSTGGTSTSSTLKVFNWNIHYGIGMDGSYGIDKYVRVIAQANPDLVALTEVEKYVPGHGNEDQPALFASKLSAATGRTWYYHHVQRYCGCVANGGGDLVLSRFPIQAKHQYALSYDRGVAGVTVIVNGRTVNFFSTHLANASEGAGVRSLQIRQLLSWTSGFSEQRIIAGDFNAGLSNLPYIAGTYKSGWLGAVAAGTAQDYPGNYKFGSTYINSYIIDFIFESLGASHLSVRSARVFDSRNANGKMASDHKPLMVTYNIN